VSVSIRYIVNDVDAAIDFYTRALEFSVAMHPAPTFAALDRGDIRLYLSAPGPGGGGSSVDGETPAPGGWNRFQIEVDDLVKLRGELSHAGHQFKGDSIRGQGGDQALIKDPSGNLVELFQPRRG
jgi:catechol 2,3-dioxygenase-like lactoylglutathione lyase family enzyme